MFFGEGSVASVGEQHFLLSGPALRSRIGENLASAGTDFEGDLAPQGTDRPHLDARVVATPCSAMLSTTVARAPTVRCSRMNLSVDRGGTEKSTIQKVLSCLREHGCIRPVASRRCRRSCRGAPRPGAPECDRECAGPARVSAQ